MKILTAYIVKEILKGTLIAILLLITLVNVFTFRDELKHLGEGNYGLKEAAMYVTLVTPTVFYELMPSAALLGSLFVLGAMQSNRELVAMRMSGISLLGLIRSVLLAGGILVLVSVAIGEFIAPLSQRTAKLIRSEAQTGHQKVVWQSLYGLWLRDGNKFINIRQIQKTGDLANVNIYELGEQDRVVRMTHADEALYAGDDRWVLKGVEATEVKDNRISAYTQSELTWESSIDPDLLKIVAVEPENLSLYDLAMYIQFLKENNQKAHTFELAFWGRVVNPLVTLVMLLVATPFVLGFKRAEATGPRMMMGVLIGLSFHVIDKIVGNAGLVYGFSPALAAVLPSMLVLSGALYAIYRLR